MFVSCEVIACELESLKLMLNEACVGDVPLQLYQIVSVFSYVELPRYSHEPSEMFS